jgi:hypothetical protein
LHSDGVVTTSARISHNWRRNKTASTRNLGPTADVATAVRKELERTGAIPAPQ